MTVLPVSRSDLHNHSDLDNRSDLDDLHLQPVPATPGTGRRPRPVLVAVATAADVTGVLPDATGRATAGGRPLVVAVITPSIAWSTDAAVQAVMARQRAASFVRLVEAVREACERHGAPQARIVELRARWRSTRRSRSRLLRRDLVVLAREHGAELHPLPDSLLGRDRG